MILALITCKDIATASNELGVTRQAIYNRLQQPAFRQRLQNERQGKFQIANSKLTDKMSEAIETLSSIMNDKEVCAGTRIKSAQILLDICLRTSEQMDILERSLLTYHRIIVPPLIILALCTEQKH